MRVLVLAVHPVTSAATRLRTTQFAGCFADAGIALTLWSFISDADIARWYGARHTGRLLVVLHGLLRVPRAVGAAARADLVIVQREAMPLGPPLLEWWAARCAPVVWDVDDAVWESFQSPTAGRIPRWLRATAGKYRTICRLATQVWAGSEVLAAWCRQHAQDVAVVPTVVDVPDVNPADPREPTACWIGSHSTGPFIERLLPALAHASPPPRVVVVGADVAPPDDVVLEQLPWSLELEADVLERSRVGLYPIDTTHPLAEGKCGLKAVLYMAHGIPPVVTPTTTNASVVRDGVDGFHAASDDEWQRAVSTLLVDDDLWQRMSASSHERARREFSVQAWAPRLAARLVALVDERRR